MSRRFARLFAVLFFVCLLAGCSTPLASPTATPPATAGPASLVVGLVTDVGGLNDRSFNHLAYLGLRESAARWGIKYRVLQSKTANDYIPNLTRFVTDRAALIIAIGFSMRNAVYQVASVHPEIKFALVDATPVDNTGTLHPLPNVADLYFKEQESGYLVGVVAGLMEKQHVGKAVHGVIGWLGGGVIPQVTHYLAGYVAGARRVDPSIRVVGAYAPGFSDTRAGEALATHQINQGADILFQVAAQTGLGYLSVAQAHDLYGIGVDTDQSYLGPVVVTSAVKHVDVAARLTVGSVVNGTFSGGDHRYGLAQGATGFAPPARVVPAGIVAQANAYARQIARGAIVPPTQAPQP